MKNTFHPNMFPTGAAATAIAETIVTDADVGGVADRPQPDPWANPLSRLPRSAPASDAETKRTTRADEVLAYLRVHGPSVAGDLCRALGITSKGGITPFIAGAIKDGRIVRIDGKYTVGGQAPSRPAPIAPVSAAGKIKVKTPQPTPNAKDATTVSAPPKQSAPPPARTASPAPEPAVASEPQKAVGRKPEFVVFVGDVQLLSWPEGEITVQTDTCTVELKREHFRALMTLVELRK